MPQTSTSNETVAQGPAGRTRRRRLRWLAVILIMLGVVGGVFWSGWRRTETGPAMGTELNGRAPAGGSGREFRVGTFNIRGGVGMSGKQDLDLTADCLKDLDLAGVNEVHGLSPLDSRSQAELLGEKLGIAWLFLPTETRWWYPSYGNAVLSRLPVTYWARLPLPCTRGNGFRNVTLVNVPREGKTVHALVTHLDLRLDRQAQLRAVSELFLAMAEPAILMGDLNSTEEDPQIQQLLGAPGVAEPVRQVLGAKASRGRCWIFTRGLKCLDAGLVDRKASDHPMVWAKLEVSP